MSGVIPPPKKLHQIHPLCYVKQKKSPFSAVSWSTKFPTTVSFSPQRAVQDVANCRFVTLHVKILTSQHGIWTLVSYAAFSEKVPKVVSFL